jgi:hypothetical protein
VITVRAGKTGEFGMTKEQTHETIETIVTSIDVMMTLSEMMYEEKLHSNHKHYNMYREQYEQKKDLLRRSLLTLVSKD